MSYLEMLKNSKNTLNDVPPKGSEPPFEPFDSGVSRHFSEKIASSPDTMGLPLKCPLQDKPVPDGCRFEAKLFRRMVNEGVLHLGGPCPLRKVCKL